MIQSLKASYTLQRIATAVLVFGANLLAAKILGPKQYGELAMFVFLAKTYPISNFGSVAGFIYSHYDNNNNHENGYLAAYAIHLCIFGVVAIGGGIFLGKMYVFSALGFLLLVPLYAVEPIYRVQRKYYVSLLPDIFLSLAVCGVALLVASSMLLQESVQVQGLMLMLVFIALAYLTILASINNAANLFRGSLRQISWSSYLETVKIGFPQYIATLAFIAFLAVDRFFLERFHPSEAMGVYMLAYQLAVGASLILTAQNFVSGVDIGESINNGDMPIDIYWRQLKVALIYAFPSYICMLVLAYILEIYFIESYVGLTWTAGFLGIGLVAFYVAGNVTGLAFFMRRQKVLTSGMLLMVLLAVVSNLIVLMGNFGSWWIGVFSCVILLGYSVTMTYYTYKVCSVSMHQ